MPDTSTITRLITLLRTMRARRYGITVREMAREMGVAEKTIRRDLKLFERIGIRLSQADGSHGRKTWRLAGTADLPPLAFSYDEAVVLYLGRRFLEPMAGTQFWEAAHSAMTKIKSTLSESALRYLDRFPSLFHSTGAQLANYASKAQIIDDLTVATEECKSVHLVYQSQQATEPATREVHPYSLVRHWGWLYLVGFAPGHDEVRSYKVDRIEAAELSELTFERPADFDIAAYLAGSFGIYEGDDDVTVFVKFLPPAARHVLEGSWHGSQALTRERDGSVLARFRLSSTVEIKSWVLSFGARAIVLEPESLRAEIAADLNRMLEAYRSPHMKTRSRATTRRGNGRSGRQ
jgi:predicted DNA-binding transcriptional regulator YafY